MSLHHATRVLLFGGGGIHDFRAICGVLREYMEADGSFSVDFVAEEYDVFLAERLETYDLAVVYHTGGKLTAEQASGLTKWVADGHGFVGVHSAADSFTSNAQYIAMLGAVFRRHPAVRRFTVSLVDPVSGVESIENHMTYPITAGMERYTKRDWESWPIFEYEVEDEQYLMEMVSHVEVLARTVYKGPMPARLRGRGPGGRGVCSTWYWGTTCTPAGFHSLKRSFNAAPTGRRGCYEGIGGQHSACSETSNGTLNTHLPDSYSV